MPDNIPQYAYELIMDHALVLDTETTGLGAEDEIVEICILTVTGAVLFNQGIRPSRPIPAEASEIHGITDTDVANCPTWADVWPQVKEIIAGRTVIAYNAPFDRDMISFSCGRYPEQIENSYLAPIGLKTRWVDLMSLWMQHVKARRRISLADTCRSVGITPGHHRAWSDAEATRQLLHHLAYKGGNNV